MLGYFGELQHMGLVPSRIERSITMDKTDCSTLESYSDCCIGSPFNYGLSGRDSNNNRNCDDTGESSRDQSVILFTERAVDGRTMYECEFCHVLLEEITMG